MGQGYEQSVVNPDETYDQISQYLPGIDLNRPDGLAPIGVIADHTLPAGGNVLVSYRYSINEFDDLRVGTSNVSTSSVLSHYPIAPRHMQAQKHLLLLEYAPTDDLTLMATLPFWDVNLDHVQRDGSPINNSTTEPGDIALRGLYTLKRWDQQQIHISLGVSLPLGVLSTERFPPTPASPDGSYPLRTSSGTYDFLPGLTYRGQNDWGTWGVQGLGTVHLGLNNAGYQLGDQADLTAWFSRRLNQHVSLSTRVDANVWGNISGVDSRLNPLLVPTNVTGAWGGQRVDLLFGTNLFASQNEFFASQWFSVEAGFPIYQNLAGPQLKLEWLLNAGWNLKF